MSPIKTRSFERDAKAVANGFLGHRLMRAERHHHVECRRPPSELLVQGFKAKVHRRGARGVGHDKQDLLVRVVSGWASPGYEFPHVRSAERRVIFAEFGEDWRGHWSGWIVQMISRGTSILRGRPRNNQLAK